MEEDTAVNFAYISDPPLPNAANVGAVKMVPFRELAVTQWPMERGRKKHKEKHSCLLKQNELCIFGFSSSVHLENLSSPQGVPQSWPGARGWHVDHPAEWAARGRGPRAASMVVWVSKLIMHVASLETYSLHPGSWSRAGTSLFRVIWVQIKNKPIPQLSWDPPTFWFVSNLDSLGYKGIELLATPPGESDSLPHQPGWAVNIWEYFIGLLSFLKFLHS